MNQDPNQPEIIHSTQTVAGAPIGRPLPVELIEQMSINSAAGCREAKAKGSQDPEAQLFMAGIIFALKAVDHGVDLSQLKQSRHWNMIDFLLSPRDPDAGPDAFPA